ncbi:MAG TPA: hypothetical protein VM142_10825 [Acidimicrobiales bacterium]|nr:hypothetical protein [Acidimicrobiales bacterium]
MKVLIVPERRWPALLVAVVLTALGTAGCSSGDDGDKADKKDTPGNAANPAPAPGPAFAFSISAADVQSAAPQAPPFPEDLKAAVKASLDTYLANGVVAPLRTGQPPAGLEGIFTGAAGARVAAGHPDRVALLEEGQPVSGKVTQDRADLKLSALIDGAGAPAVVTAQVDLAVTVKGKDTTLTVARTGELTLVFDNNAWRIDAFDMRTARDSK